MKPTAPMSRRSFVAGLAGVAGAGIVAACNDSTAPTAPPVITDFAEPARLHLAPRAPTQPPATGGSPIWFQGDRLTYLRVPPTYRRGQFLPLVVAFHGAGGRGIDWFSEYGALTDAAGMVLLAPDSAGGTWDAMDGPFGPDMEMLNFAVDAAFDRVGIDASRIAFVGFSDGASYALSLGLANGDNVRHVVAHSPGFYVDVPRHGQPSFFVSHGTEDAVLFIEDTSEVIVPLLRGLGDSVEYIEFDGPHTIPPSIATLASQWLASGFAN